MSAAVFAFTLLGVGLYYAFRREIGMAKGKQKSNREAKKPKKEKLQHLAKRPEGGCRP